MIPSLYEPFKKWSENGSVWIISDPHFDDSDCKLMNPNWITPQEHIDIINKNVYKNDTLVCLGDCGNLEWFKKLKVNHKVLIKGNHDDKGDSVYKKEKIKEVYDADKINEKTLFKILKEKYPNDKITLSEEYLFHPPFHRWTVIINNNLFDEIYKGALFISPQILLSHEPIYDLPFCVNIHGHVHNGEYEYYDFNEGKHINLAADVANWKLFNLGKEIKNGLISNINSIHRITIDNAIAKKIK